MKNQELEVKYFVLDLQTIENRLISAGAVLEQPRLHEKNLRLDTVTSDLSRRYQVLRLREDDKVTVTFKGPGYDLGGARLRKEIEYTASSFEQVLSLFEALGYQPSMSYEKFRGIYNLDGAHITLDEMPYGCFVEIEADTAEAIQCHSKLIGLEWEKRVLDSYVMIFDKLREIYNFSFRDLSFSNFNNLQVDLIQIGIFPADIKS